MVRFPQGCPCVCHLATAGVLRTAVRRRKERGAQSIPRPPTDVSLQFSQAADAIKQELFVMQIQVTGMPLTNLKLKCKGSPSS